MTQKKSPALKAGLDHSSRLNVTLAGCSPAEPASVSVQQCKIQFINLYLQPVKIRSHLPAGAFQLMEESFFWLKQELNNGKLCFSVQIIAKERGIYKVVKTIGSAQTDQQIATLVYLGKQELAKIQAQGGLFVLEDDALIESFLSPASKFTNLNRLALS